MAQVRQVRHLGAVGVLHRRVRLGCGRVRRGRSACRHPGRRVDEQPLGLPIYFGIVALFFVPNLFLGRRAMCHCVCWMAPFMVLGEKLGAALRLPQLRIEAEPDRCVDCGKCEGACPMSLPVERLLQAGTIGDAECIQCAACADACPKDVLKLRMGRR